MKSFQRQRLNALGLWTVLLCVAASAHAVGLERFDVGAFVGARFDVGTVELPALETDLTLDPNVSFGAMADVNVYDMLGGNVFVELILGYQKTQLTADTVSEQGAFVDDMSAQYYHGGVGYQWKLVRWKPYVVFTAGATHLSSDNSGSSTDFSYAIGGGLKYQFLLNFGARLDARWYGTPLDLGETDWICGKYDCFLATNKDTLWQADITLGAFASF